MSLTRIFLVLHEEFAEATTIVGAYTNLPAAAKRLARWAKENNMTLMKDASGEPHADKGQWEGCHIEEMALQKEDEPDDGTEGGYEPYLDPSGDSPSYRSQMQDAGRGRLLR